MPGTPEWLDVSVIPGLIAPEHRDQVVWLYPSSLLNRRPPSQAPPSGARTTSDLPRQPESGSTHCFVTVGPLLALPYDQLTNGRCPTLRRILVGRQQTIIWIHCFMFAFSADNPNRDRINE